MGRGDVKGVHIIPPPLASPGGITLMGEGRGKCMNLGGVGGNILGREIVAREPVAD